MTIVQDPIVKIILVGESGVGKTALFTAFSENTFASTHVATIGVDFCMKRIALEDGTIAKLQIWDSAGMERFRALTASYFRGADVICLLYDMTSRESFTKLTNWVHTIRKTTQEEFMFLVIGNKQDLSPAYRQVSEEEGALFAASLSAGFFETSAKTFLHVVDVFVFLAKESVKRGVKHVPRVLTLDPTTTLTIASNSKHRCWPF